MPRFQFRLASVLRLREAARDERRLRLAEALRAEQLLGEQRAQVQAALGDVQQRARDAARPGPVQVDRLVDAQRYELVLLAQLADLGQKAQLLAREIDARRQALVAADRDVRVLEKLREQQRERHRAGEQARDTKQLDEIGGRRAALREPE